MDDQALMSCYLKAILRLRSALYIIVYAQPVILLSVLKCTSHHVNFQVTMIGCIIMVHKSEPLFIPKVIFLAIAESTFIS